MIRNSILAGGFGAALLIGFYFMIVGALSEWSLARTQFLANWYWIVGLAIGFGIQLALFVYLRALHRERLSGTVIATTGTFSGFTMIACCTHYLVGILPALGAFGLATIAEQYQIEFFLLGALFNAAGIIYMLAHITKHTSNHG